MPVAQHLSGIGGRPDDRRPTRLELPAPQRQREGDIGEAICRHALETGGQRVGQLFGGRVRAARPREQLPPARRSRHRGAGGLLHHHVGVGPAAAAGADDRAPGAG